MENIEEYANSIAALQVSTITTLINHKYAVNCDNHDKAEVITEILNEIKLLLTPTDGNVH